MKTAAYIFYVVTVLLISGFTRAHAALPINSTDGQYQTPVNINQVTLDASKSALLVAGSLPNPCYPNPGALLTQDASNPTVLTLHLSSALPTNACITKVKYFTSELNLPRLALSSRIEVDAKALYTIRVAGYEFEARVPGTELKN